MALTRAEMEILLTAKNQADAALKQVAKSITAIDTEAKKPAASLKVLGDHLSSLAGAPFKAVGGLTDALGKLGLAAVGVKGLADAAIGLAGGLSAPIQAASDLNESVNKMQVVFGPAAKGVADFADTAAKSLGQSRQQAIEATSTFGNLFTSLGLGQKPAADMSVAVVKLASDLASFNNIRPEDALEKLRSGLVGEAEPLRTLGVAINEAAVQTEAMRLGLVDANGEISEAGKVQARYSLILQQTKNAQGDFANTSTGMANATRIIQATFKDLQADIGARFYPTIQTLVSQFAQALPAALNYVNPLLDRLGGIFADVVQEGRTLITTAQNIAGTYGLGGIQAVAITLEQRIREVFGDRTAQTFHDFLQIAQNVVTVFGKVYDALRPVVSGFAEWARGGLPAAVDFITQLSDKLPGLVDDFRNNATAVTLMKDALILLVAVKAAAEISAIAGSLKALTLAFNPGVLGLGAFIAAVAIFVNTHRELTAKWIAETVEAFKEAVAAYGSGFSKLGAALHSFADTVAANITAIGDYFAAIPTRAKEQIDLLIHYLKNIGPSVAGAASEVGQSVVNGLLSGLKQNAPIVAAAAQLGRDAASALREAVDSHSPSKVAEKIGIDFVEGFAQGLGDDDEAIQTAQELGDGVAETVSEAIAQTADSVPDIMDQLAAALGTAVPRALTPVEKELADFNDRLATEETKFTRRMADLQAQLADATKSTDAKIEDETIRHARKMADLNEDVAGAKTVAARKAALQAIQDENTRHQRNLEDIQRKGGEDQEKARQDILDKIETLERDHARRVDDLQNQHVDDMVDAEQEMGRRRGQAISDFVSSFDDLNREVTLRSSQIASDASHAIQQAINETARSIDEARRNAEDAISSLENNQVLERALRARRASFGGTQDDAARRRQQAQEDADLAVRQATDVAALEANATKDARDTEKKRVQEDADAEYELARDLSRAKTDDEVQQIRQRFADQKADRDRRRRQDDQDRSDRLRDQRDELAARQRADQKALADRRSREADDRVFRQQQAKALQDFNDQLDDEAQQRQIARILDERDQRINAINDALREKEQAIRDNEGRERDLLNQSYQNKLDDLKKNFFDKLGPLTDAQMLLVTAFLDGVSGKASDVMALIAKVTTPATTAAVTAAATTGGGGGGGGSSDTSIRPGGKAGETVSEVVNFYKGTGLTQSQAEAQVAKDLAAKAGTSSPVTGTSSTVGGVTGHSQQSTSGGTAGAQLLNALTGQGFAGGGLVYGPRGASRLIKAHGGEGVFTPEQMAAMGGSGGVTVAVTVMGSVTSERDLVQSIRTELLKIGQRNGSIFGGRA